MALILLASMAVGCRTHPRPEFAPSLPSLRIVTYNINWGGANAPLIARYLREIDADIVFLQESHANWEQYLHQHLGQTYPYRSFHHSGGAGGIAFLSKHRLSNVHPIGPEASWFPALKAEAQTPFGSIHLLNVHLKPPLTDRGSVSLSAYSGAPAVHQRELSEFLRSTDLSAPTIIAGDFNENERRHGVQWLIGRGFTDALSIYDTKTKTWAWRLMPGISIANRYDHILFSTQFHCTGAGVSKVRASDHRPVVATIIQAAPAGQ